MRTLPSLSIFFPAYNDAQILPYMIIRADTAARAVTRRYEIIVVNDGSRDHTADVVRSLKRRYPELRMVSHQTNRGYGSALISGFKAARYDWIFYTDGDGQYDPDELSSLVRYATGTTDVVNGYKRNRQDPWYRIVTGHLYNAMVHMLFNPPIRDVDCDFRLIRKAALSRIHLRATSGAICAELVDKLHRTGAVFRETPVNHCPRRFGSSQFFSPGRILETFRELRYIRQ